MENLKYITALIKPYISLFTLAIIAVADYIWEDKYFICPCANDDLRTAYSLVFVLSPASYLFLANCNFRVLCRTCQNFCTDTFFKSLGDLLRPFMLAGAWIIYSILDPRFSDCIQREFNRVHNRNCTEEDRSEGKRRAYVALTILILSLSALILAGLVGCCRGCRWCKKLLCLVCCKDCLFENLTQEKKLIAQTLTTLEEEDLLEDGILVDLDDSDFKKLEDKLTMGQLKILKKHCRELKRAEQHRSSESSETPGTSTASSDIVEQETQLQLQVPAQSNQEPCALIRSFGRFLRDIFRRLWNRLKRAEQHRSSESSETPGTSTASSDMNLQTPQGSGEGNAAGAADSCKQSTSCCCQSFCKRTKGYLNV